MGITRAALVVNREKAGAEVLAGEIAGELKRRGIGFDSFASGGRIDAGGVPGGAPGSAPGIVFSLGGDGTALAAARAFAPLGMPVFPINLGTLGFLAGVAPAEWRAVFARWLEGKTAVSRRLMLEASAERGGETVFREVCLNDAVISAARLAKIIRLRAFSGALPLGAYRSDGLIAATPTGSTAYSLAAGGPVLDPELEALVINPISPFPLSHRPVVLPACEPVTVQVEEGQGGVLLTADGQVSAALEPGDRVVIRKAAFPCLLIGAERAGVFRALRTKLSGGAGA